MVPKVGGQFPNQAVADGEYGAWHNTNKHSVGRKKRGISLVRMFGIGVKYKCPRVCSIV